MANYVFETATQEQAATFTANDFLIFTSTTTNASNVSVTPTNPNDTLTTGYVITAAGKSLTFNASNLSAASIANRIVFNDASELTIGTAGNDSGADFTGGNANDVIYGFAGNDELSGGNGADYLYGGIGGDTLTGGEGNDHLYGNALTTQQGATDGADLLNGGNGGDYLQGNAGDDTLNGDNGSDRIFGGAGNDLINGGDDQDQINGNTGNDTISGGAGNDVLRGGQGTDSLSGGDGNDIVYGDLGADTVAGGAGFDVLFGGDGNDVFQFAAGDALSSNVGGSGTNANLIDVIGDYVDGQDKIDLSITLAGATSVLKDTSGTTFGTLKAALDYAQQLLDNSGTVADNNTEIAALKFGTDTYLFWTTDVSGTINSAVKVIGVEPTVFTNTDFI